MQQFIDGNTLQPRRFGEVYSDRNIRIAGEARYLSDSSQVETRGLKLICAPTNGGAEAITVIPNGLYSLAVADTSIWVQLRRAAGSTTVTLGSTLLVVGAGAQSPPQENWVQLFYRSSVASEIIAYGSFLVGLSPNWTRFGITRATGIYDAIVGQNTADPSVTHTNIQTAINDCVDGNRILILEGVYNITSATGYSATSALSWVGKTLTIEGEGYNTIIENGGGFARAFSIQSSTSAVSGSQGSGSRILNLRINLFNQTVQFDGGAGFGIRNVDVNIWQTDFVTASYVAPAAVGTGTSEQNTVREKTTSLTGVYEEKYTIASSTAASNISRVESSGSLAFNELVGFQRPTSGFGILPLGSVIATFPHLSPAAYVCTTTTAADANGFVQCAGGVIADATSPFNGMTIPNINNNVFLMGNVTSSNTILGANSLNATVPAAGLTVSGGNSSTTVSWSGGSAPVGGSASLNRIELNSGQVAHSHVIKSHSHAVGSHSHLAGGYYGCMTFYSQLVIMRDKTPLSSPSLWTSTRYHEGGDFRGSNGADNRAWAEGLAIQGQSGNMTTNLVYTGGIQGEVYTSGSTAQWSPGTIPITLSGASISKTLFNSDQTPHSHTWSGSVAGTATTAVWDNRPQYITARYLMRIK